MASQNNYITITQCNKQNFTGKKNLVLATTNTNKNKIVLKNGVLTKSRTIQELKERFLSKKKEKRGEKG